MYYLFLTLSYLFLALFWICVAIWCFCFIKWIQYTFIKKYKESNKRNGRIGYRK